MHDNSTHSSSEQSTVQSETSASGWSLTFCQFNRFWQIYYPQIIGTVWKKELCGEDTEFYRIRFGDEKKAKDIVTHYLRSEIGNPDNEKERLEIADILEDMRIRLMPGIGYSFKINDRGIDLPRPPKPKGDDIDDIFRKYQYRRVGTPAISIPGLEMCRDSGFVHNTDTTTGRDFIAIGANRLSLVEIFSAEILDKWLGILRMFVTTEGTASNLSAELKPEDIFINVTPEFYLLFDEFIDAITCPMQCWHLKGQDFMSLQVELPRLIAHVWFDEVLSKGEIPEFKRRFLNQDQHGNPDKKNNQTRTIFDERLETTLHQNLNFVVKEVNPSKGECSISNKGIHLVLPTKPSLNEMFEAWARGKAGNPIFTDTFLCS